MKNTTMLMLASTFIGCGLDVEQGAEDATQVVLPIQNGNTDFSGFESMRIRTALVEGQGRCSGTVLDSQTVLTARHCVNTTSGFNGPILSPASLVDVRIDGGTARPAQALVPMESSDDPDHDVALIFL